MTAEKTKEEQLQDIARCAYDSIAEMVAALQCDRERLGTLAIAEALKAELHRKYPTLIV